MMLIVKKMVNFYNSKDIEDYLKSMLYLMNY